MPIVLANDDLRLQLPQARIVIRASRDQVRGIRTERAVPNPALVSGEIRLEGERAGWLVLVGGFRIKGRGLGFDTPDAGAVVRGAGREVAHVGREQHAVDVGGVSLEVADGHDVGFGVGLDHAPDVDVALVPSSVFVI